MSLLKTTLGLKPVPHDWYSENDHGDAVRIRYLGTAGFVISDAERTLVLDPFITRPNLVTTLTRRLAPDTERIARQIPNADDVLVGHAHYDHILDAPDLCRMTGARLIGSRASVMVGRAAGLPEHQLLETLGGEDIPSGSWTVRGLPSRHGKALAGRVPLPGDIPVPPPWPARLGELRHGLVLNWWVNTGALRVVHIDSADFINEELDGLEADVVCLCAIGRKYRPNYAHDVISRLRPRWVIPCHWDTMITPVEREPDMIPGVDLPGFLEEIRAEGAEPLLTPMLAEQSFPACRDHEH